MTDLARLLPRAHRVRCWERADRDPVDLLCTCSWSEVRWPQRTNKRPDCPIHGGGDIFSAAEVDDLLVAARGLVGATDPAGHNGICNCCDAIDSPHADDCEWVALRRVVRGRLPRMSVGRSPTESADDPIAGLVRLPPPYRKVLAEVVTEAPITGDEGISVVQCVVDCEPGTWVGVLTTALVDGQPAPDTKPDDDLRFQLEVETGMSARWFGAFAEARDQLAQALALLRSHADVCSRHGEPERLRTEADRIEAMNGPATPGPTREQTEIEHLHAELDEAQLRSIEARNPGIDMDEVRRLRGTRSSTSATRDRTAEVVAQAFHETYERLAPSFGYETRKASAVPWADVPDQNKRLMVAVAGELLALFGRSAPEPPETQR